MKNEEGLPLLQINTKVVLTEFTTAIFRWIYTKAWNITSISIVALQERALTTTWYITWFILQFIFNWRQDLRIVKSSRKHFNLLSITAATGSVYLLLMEIYFTPRFSFVTTDYKAIKITKECSQITQNILNALIIYP